MLEGAEIFFGCNPGFVPAGRMRAVCGADQRWNPDPGDHVCTCEFSHNVCIYVQVAATMYIILCKSTYICSIHVQVLVLGVSPWC